MDKKSSFKYKSWYYFFATLQTINGIVVHCSDTTTSSPWSLNKYIGDLETPILKTSKTTRPVKF